MKITLKTFIIVFAFIISGTLCAQKTEAEAPASRITQEDLSTVIGEWTGSLTYIDYSSNKPYTMPANLSVKQAKNKNQLTLYNTYPKEPKANNTDKIKITKEGAFLNKKRVASREVLANGNIQIHTEHIGKDDNKTALIRNVYLLGNDQFIIRKEVQFEGSDVWIKRSEFNYTR
ncbi:MAG: hypothetical protein WBM53_04550 [Maribacter sp.]